MITNLVTIGNSRGVRIPKVLLEESGLEGKVELKVKTGEIKIVSAPGKPKPSETALLSDRVLSDWNRPEEDEAWKSIQLEK